MAIRLSDSWLDELRMRSSLEEIVSEYVPLKQKGRRYWGCCPFHNEKTPSFSVDSEAQLFYCFGCHKGGTVIHFVMEMEHMEFMEAVRYLAERAHMELPEGDAGSARAPESAQERERMYEANREAARYFHGLLWQPEGAKALNYLYQRGLNDSDIRRFGLGASPADWTGLYAELTRRGFEASILERAGLIRRRENGYGDMFVDRAMFPIINPQGRVLGFGGRAMGDDQPKYLNTSDTPIFNKRQGLYALNWAKKERGIGHLVLVEGYMDTLSLRKAGVQGVVATLGTALTVEQTRLMKRYAPEVWVSYDGDSAGQKAALRALNMLDEAGIQARVLDYPAGMDPDDFIRAQGLSGFEGLPKHTATEYRLLRARDGLALDTQEGMTRYATAACEILRKVSSPIELENHLRKLSRETGYDKQVLLSQIRLDAAQPVRPAPSRPRPHGDAHSKVSSGESALLTLLSRGLLPRDLVKPEDFSEGDARIWAKALQSGVSAAQLLESLDTPAQRDACMEALSYEPIPSDREEALTMAETCLRSLRRERMQRRSQEIEQEIAQADPERRKQLYQQLFEINQAMDE